MTKSTRTVTEAELARHYDETRDLSDFEGGAEEPVEVRRNVTISVRFSEEEIAALHSKADAAGRRSRRTSGQPRSSKLRRWIDDGYSRL